jgi:EAL domain-containing protein (putative c-di-GMP-specific phosphodiesterase class I)
VLTEACTRIKAWEDNAFTRGLTLAINVSAHEFRQANFIAAIRHAIQDTGANPTHLKIELTEGSILNNIADTLEKMLALKSLGIRCSLDDFGTGYSFLSYLTRLPLGEIKIDQAFVQKLPDSRGDAIIAQTIIAMATNLGLNVVAEGVETENQRAFLNHHGSHIYQGYLCCPPLPLEAFEQFVSQWPGQCQPGSSAPSRH